MIAIVGGEFITLKGIMVGEGFPELHRNAPRGRGRIQELFNGIFNCSLTQSQMQERVYRRWGWVEGDLPVINKNLITNKLEAQRKMEAEGLGENILVHYNDTSVYDYVHRIINREEWVMKPYASQGGTGIRTYDGGLLRSGFYLQKKVNKVREFRAPVGLWLSNPVFTIQEKKPKPEMWHEILANVPYHWPATQQQRERLPLTWNIESGFYFKRATTPENRAEKVNRFGLFRRMEEIAIKAVKALDYQFGAVDILMDEDRNLWIVEVNSHPAIKNPNSKEIYIEALAPLKTASKMDLFGLIQQTAGNTVRRTMTRRA